MAGTGFPIYTRVRGEVVVDKGEFVGQPGSGRFIPGAMDADIVSTIR